MKKVLFWVGLALLIVGALIWQNRPKILPYYDQLTRHRIPLNQDLQPASQKTAHFTGSHKCRKCHKEQYRHWRASMHSKMIQEIAKDPSVVVANFSSLPADADFTLKDALYTIGGKFKQRYMIPATINGKSDFRLGNYQWNNETKKWQRFKPYKYWYHDAYAHDNRQFPTSTTCDGCHFVGFMSKGKRIEPAIGCESCHGPGGAHAANPDSPIFKASLFDPIRTNEVCLQCHMRNRDKRLANPDVTQKDLWMEALDYPKGYEPGKPLVDYKLPAPFMPGKKSKEFWPTGQAKKNRTQGNEYIHTAMYKHGITCINCHDPHRLDNTAQNPRGNDGCMRCHSFGSVIGPHQASLEAHTHHKADSDGSKCIECHMPKTARHTGKSPLTVRSHRFRFVYPKETKAYNMPPQTNACYACHSDKSLDDLQKTIEKWGMGSWSAMEKY